MSHVHRVLVVEDDRWLCDAMVETLTAGGCEAVGASDGSQAFALLRPGHSPCLIFLDLMMPGMDGWQFIEQLRLRAAFARTPVVVVTAYGTTEGVRSLGAVDCLKKPFQLEQLREFVARYCTHGSL